MSSDTGTPRLWHVPYRSNLHLVGETDMGWDRKTETIPAHTAEEALEIAFNMGLVADGEPTPWLEATIGGTQFQIILQPIGA